MLLLLLFYYFKLQRPNAFGNKPIGEKITEKQGWGINDNKVVD